MILQIESTVMPYLQVLSEFREGVRQIAREKKGESSRFPVLLHMRLEVIGTKLGERMEVWV